MSKEENKFIEATEDKETKEDDFASTSAERHNDIEEEYQNTLVDKALEEAGEMEADIGKLIAKKRSIKILWKKGTDKQLKRLESLKAQ
ncbi:hypothetical protein RFI_29392 [Reticulomyxa filosa]|uniref:Uncharacterized protein n=1 Tax=Reticulomyxa filosa TaxID=46433 RepID=X6M1H5_RETFI|nr:hypothetical protein RFI_29392 [Reticulomyxa filosa]|eukprot:ETO07998.1 hypothetical protein RFI_29392 [Reticulomyxa filosa]